MTTLTAGPRAGEYIAREANGGRSREQITVASGADLVAGQVIAQVTNGARTASGAAGVPAPAGATITASPTAALNTLVGVHRFECIVGGAGALSKWRHTDPNGQVIGIATAGSAYTGGGLSGLTITDSGTDPTAGEAFNVTVTAVAGSLKWKKLAPAALDGTQNAAGILYGPTDSGSADVRAVATVRDAEVITDMLTWPSGISDSDKAAAIALLKAQHIILRD